MELPAPVVEDAAPDAAATPSHLAADQASAQEAEAELLSYKAALDLQAIVGITDRAGRITGVNDPFCRISQYSREELVGRTHSLLNSRHHPRAFFVEMWRTIGSGATWHGEICNRAKDGSLYWVDTTIVPRHAASGAITGYVSIRYDITKRKTAEAALIEENRKRERAELLLRDVIEALPNGIAAYDADDRLVLFNEAFREFYDRTAPAIVEGATFESILRYGIDHGQFARIGSTRTEQDAWFEARLRDHHNPGRRWIQHLADDRWLQVQERVSRSGHVVGVRTDVTDLKLAERKIKQQAERDPLTGLYNRRVVLDRLGRLLASASQAERFGALVLVDLDGFKAVNDTLGHDAGDSLLTQVGERFQATVRKADIVARLGGDEFAIVLFNLTTPQDAERIVDKLQRCLLPPVQLAARPVTLSASFGVAIVPEHGATPVELMKHADLALYQAKEHGRSTYAVYTPQLQLNIERQASMTEALRNALAEDQILVALQPQTSFTTGRHTGFEALVRWQHEGAMVPPPELISIAENSGLIVNLGYRIIDRAMATMRGMHEAGLAPGRLALNVASAQLQDADFVRRLRELMARHRLHPVDIEIEITENVVIGPGAHTIVATLQELHAAGIGIALDDFGTGYASLSHLKRLPLDRLKIDRSFVRGLHTNPQDAVIARAIITLAHGLGLQVVAEGVETERQFQFLAEEGCDYAQGYLISVPLTARRAHDYMRTQAEFTVI